MTRCALTGLHGSMVALVTPFRDGRIDEEAFEALCRRQIDRGSTALVPCSLTGEAPTLSPQEQGQLIRLCVSIARGRVPVIAAAGANSTAAAIALARTAETAGADAILSVTPYYNRPGQAGLYQHFAAIQAAVGVPVLLHDLPGHTAATLAPDTILRLAELPRIGGLVDATGDPARFAGLRRRLDRHLLICGDDGLLPACLALGADGGLSTAANVAPALCAALHRAWADRTGSDPHGRRFAALSSVLAGLATALTAAPSPIAVKAALARLGLIDGTLRLPLTPLTGPAVSDLHRLLAAIDIAEQQAAA